VNQNYRTFTRIPRRGGEHCQRLRVPCHNSLGGLPGRGVEDGCARNPFDRGLPAPVQEASTRTWKISTCLLGITRCGLPHRREGGGLWLWADSSPIRVAVRDRTRHGSPHRRCDLACAEGKEDATLLEFFSSIAGHGLGGRASRIAARDAAVELRAAELYRARLAIPIISASP
jgi:hypothetical protein